MKTFLVGVDGSPESEMAGKKAIELAKALGARLLLAHVSHDESATAAAYAAAAGVANLIEHDYAPALLAQAERECRAAGVSAETSSDEGPVADTLAAIAEREKVDMVIVGHRGRGAVTRALLGSVADRLVQVCHTPVLVVR
jgi:nucleotide-binding universal stress UspA family protein